MIWLGFVILQTWLVSGLTINQLHIMIPIWEDIMDPLPVWPLMLFSSQLCSWCNHSCPDRIYVWRQRLGRPNLFNICGSLGEADSTLETGWRWNKSTIRKKDVWSTASSVRIEFISCFQVIVIITRCWSKPDADEPSWKNGFSLRWPIFSQRASGAL